MARPLSSSSFKFFIKALMLHLTLYGLSIAGRSFFHSWYCCGSIFLNSCISALKVYGNKIYTVYKKIVWMDEISFSYLINQFAFASLYLHTIFLCLYLFIFKRYYNRVFLAHNINAYNFYWFLKIVFCKQSAVYALNDKDKYSVYFVW